jgi:hypothetical protein
MQIKTRQNFARLANRGAMLHEVVDIVSTSASIIIVPSGYARIRRAASPIAIQSRMPSTGRLLKTS